MMRLPKSLLVVLVLALFLGLVSPALAAEAKGKIKTINADKNEFVVTDTDGKDWTFTLSDEAKVRLNDQDKKLSDLKEGDEVTVTYEKKDDKMMVSNIRCDRK
jgi:Cu/Ag efflux protein CusF